jgi:hypothetical protein
MARSIPYRRTEPVWPQGSLEEADLHSNAGSSIML